MKKSNPNARYSDVAKKTSQNTTYYSLNKNYLNFHLVPWKWTFCWVLASGMLVFVPTKKVKYNSSSSLSVASSTIIQIRWQNTYFSIYTFSPCTLKLLAPEYFHSLSHFQSENDMSMYFFLLFAITFSRLIFTKEFKLAKIFKILTTHNNWKTFLTLLAPILQNGQTHSNNSSAICQRIVWVWQFCETGA